MKVYIGRDGVKKRMNKDLQGFSNLKLSDLQGLKKEWGEEKLRGMLWTYNLKNSVFYEMRN